MQRCRSKVLLKIAFTIPHLRTNRDIAIVRVSSILGTTPFETDAVAQFVAPHAPIGRLVEVNDMRCPAGEMSGRLPLSVDPVKDLCGDDPVSDVEPLAGPKDSPEQFFCRSTAPGASDRPSNRNDINQYSDIISLLFNRHNIFRCICHMQIKHAYVY